MYVGLCYNQTNNCIERLFRSYNKRELEIVCLHWTDSNHQVYIFNRNLFRFLHATGFLKIYLRSWGRIREFPKVGLCYNVFRRESDYLFEGKDKKELKEICDKKSGCVFILNKWLYKFLVITRLLEVYILITLARKYKWDEVSKVEYNAYLWGFIFKDPDRKNRRRKCIFTHIGFCYNHVSGRITYLIYGKNAKELYSICNEHFIYLDEEVYVLNKHLFRSLSAAGLLKRYLNACFHIRFKLGYIPEAEYEEYLNSKPYKPKKKKIRIAFMPKIGICYDHRAKEIKYLTKGFHKKEIRGYCQEEAYENSAGKRRGIWHIYVFNKYLFKILSVTHLLKPYLKHRLKMDRIRVKKEYGHDLRY